MTKLCHFLPKNVEKKYSSIGIKGDGPLDEKEPNWVIVVLSLWCQGICSMVILVVWLLLTSNTPSQHPRISTAEKNYIVKSLKGQVSEEGGNDVSVL